MLTCHFEVTENSEDYEDYENYESGCENIRILCRRSVREKKLRIINMNKRKMITKKEMSEITDTLKRMKELNNLQMIFAG